MIKQTAKEHYSHALTQIVGSHVRLVNETHLDDLNSVRIHVHGKLEAPVDDGEWFVRIGDDPRGHGINGIGFPIEAVTSFFQQPSGIHEITLKG